MSQSRVWREMMPRSPSAAPPMTTASNDRPRSARNWSKSLIVLVASISISITDTAQNSRSPHEVSEHSESADILGRMTRNANQANASATPAVALRMPCFEDVFDASLEGDRELAAEGAPELGGIQPDHQTIDPAGSGQQSLMPGSGSSAHRYRPKPFGRSRRARAAVTAVARRFASARTTRSPNWLMR